MVQLGYPGRPHGLGLDVTFQNPVLCGIWSHSWPHRLIGDSTLGAANELSYSSSRLGLFGLGWFSQFVQCEDTLKPNYILVI